MINYTICVLIVALDYFFIFKNVQIERDVLPSFNVLVVNIKVFSMEWLCFYFASDVFVCSHLDVCLFSNVVMCNYVDKVYMNCSRYIVTRVKLNYIWYHYLLQWCWIDPWSPPSSVFRNFMLYDSDISYILWRLL